MFELSLFNVLILLLFGVVSQFDPNIDAIHRNEITWSATNDHLAIATLHGLWIYDFEVEVATLVSNCNNHTFNPVFSADGGLLAYSTLDGMVYVVDRETQTDIAYIKPGYMVHHMLFDPTDSRLIIAYRGFYNNFHTSRISVWDYQNDEILTTTDIGDISVLDIQFDLNTDVLWVTGTVFGTDAIESHFWAIELTSGNAIIYLPVQQADARGVRMDNSLYVYSVHDYFLDTYYFLIGDLKNRSSTNTLYEVSYDSSISEFDVTVDSHRIAMITQDNHLRVQPLYRQIYELEIQHDSNIRSVMFDMSGEQLAVMTWGELPEVEIWDMETMTHSMTLRTADWYQADCGG